MLFPSIIRSPLCEYAAAATTKSFFLTEQSCQRLASSGKYLQTCFNLKYQLNSSNKRLYQMSTSASSSTKPDTEEGDSTTPTLNIAQNIEDVRHRITLAREESPFQQSVRLVAVSKTKPLEYLQNAYDAGQRVFGENYVHEIIEKSPKMPSDVEWHFIGHVQSNKAKVLVQGVRNLSMIETLDSKKLADKFNTALKNLAEGNDSGDEVDATPVPEGEREEGTGDSSTTRILKVLIQVDTSGEDTKSGVAPEDALALAIHIKEKCSYLQFSGVMTIGAPGDMTCFDRLVECRNFIAQSMGIPNTDLEVSMGMSSDFEEAIKKGSTNVRPGTTIFGARNYNK